MTSEVRPRIIVTVPVRDEAAILPRFLQATLLWADAVVVSDQGSTDRSAEIARSFQRVTVIANPDPSFSEVGRQQQLIAVARRLFPGPRFLIALDADEILSANVLSSAEWRAALLAAPGTCVRIGRAELCPTLSDYFIEWGRDRGNRFMFAYVDDDAAHDGPLLHSTRLPEPPGAPQIELQDMVVLHYARGNMARVKSKDRWYQCFERLHQPDLSDVQIWRRYDWYERLLGTFNVRSCPDEWFNGYRDAGVDLSESAGERLFWTDWDVLRMFAAHGTRRFAHLDIWSVDWEALRRAGQARHIDGLPTAPIRRPDKLFDRAFRLLLSISMRRRYRRYSDALLIRGSRLIEREQGGQNRQNGQT